MNISVREWRITQISRYLKLNPMSKPKEILEQISSQVPNPQPEAGQCNMSRFLKSIELRFSYSANGNTFNLSACHSVLKEHIPSVTTRWNRACPSGVSIINWRKIQLGRYLMEFPGHGPKKLILELRSHTPNPQPEVTENWMGRFVRKWRSEKWHPVRSKAFSLTLDNEVVQSNVEPQKIYYDSKIPPGYTMSKQRNIQLAIYIDEFPSHGPSKIMS